MRTGRPAARSSLGKWILKRWLYWSCTRALVKALPAQWPNRAMSQVDQATQQAAANSEETSSAAEELSGQSQELISLVEQFQLGASDRKQTQRRTAAKFAAPRRAQRVARKSDGNGFADHGSNGHGSNGHAASAKSLIPIENDPDFADF